MKKTKKIFVAITFAIVILFQVGVYAASNMSDLISPIEYTEEFKQYLNLSDEEKENTAVIPRPYEIIKTDSKPKNPFKLARMLGSTAERSYTLKTFIPENLVIKDQGTTNTCWAFSELASLETNLALKNYKNNITQKYYDFSEKHMEYGVTRQFLNNQINTYGFNRELNAGGNYVLATAYLTNGLGAVNEDSMVFSNELNQIELSQIENKAVTGQVLDTKEFAETTNEDETIKDQIKDYIKNYGGLTASVYGSPLFSDYYNNETGALYCNNEEECPVTHAVVIIGWDDDYSKENFNEKHKPTNNGAWIAKNSYGTEVEYNVEDFRKAIFDAYKGQQIESDPSEHSNWDTNWNNENEVPEDFIEAVLTASGYTINGDKASIKVGDNGFWHISYEDINIYKQLQGITNSTDKKNYDNIYQYNYNGADVALGAQTNKIYIANVFTKKTNEQEYINQVAIDTPEEVTCKVYVNPNGESKAINDLQKVTLKDGESETFEAGYHTLEFSNPIKIIGNSFVVMVEIQGKRSEELQYSIETPVEDSIFDSIEVETGKCFITVEEGLESNEWLDLSKDLSVEEKPISADSTIKAFTVIKNDVLSKIEIQTPPTKTRYIEGENFESAGMKVVAVYENGITEEITNYTVENGTSLKKDQTSVKITYNGKEAMQQITVSSAESAPVGINFTGAKSNIKGLKTYTYSKDSSKNYVVAEIDITNVVRNLNNDKYEYYYYISTNPSETNIQDWVKITENQTSDNTLTLTINSKDIKNYDKIADADRIYIYIKEIVTKNDVQKTTISNGIEIMSTVDKAEVYVDDKIYKAPQATGEKDDTTLGGKLPQTGQGVMIFGAIVIVVILGIIFVKKYIKYNEKM